MINKMEERRKWKNTNTPEGKENYRRLNNELRRETDKAKENWWSDQCKELEELDHRGRSDLMYQKVKTLTKKKRQNTSRIIKDKQGKDLTEASEKGQRWKEYIEELYAKDQKPTEKDMELEEDTAEEGPEILYDEFEAALKKLKSGKAAGIDDIPAEFLKHLGKEAKNELFDICRQVYSKGKWPADFLKSIIIPIEKKVGAQECSDYRTISLISHASKIILRILTERLENKAKSYLGEDQYGFRKGLGTRDAIGVMRVLIDRSIEHDQKVFTCFVDYEKAFDRINWVKMMQILKNIGVDWKDRRLIRELYRNQTARVRIDNWLSEECIIGRGARQGCSLSPILYILYDEAMMKEAVEDLKQGIQVGGEYISSVRFADDKAIVADTAKGLQLLMTRLNEVTEEYGMKINIKKTKVMVVTKKGHRKAKIEIAGQELEQVSHYKYLGSILTEDGRCEKDMKTRLAMAKGTFNDKIAILSSKLDQDLKKRMIKTLIWSIALYSAETWILKRVDRDRLEAFEMWCWRKMLGIKWMDKISNRDVLDRAEEERSILSCIWTRKKKWIGHVIRGDNLLRRVIEGRMLGKPPRGRKRFGMLSDLKGKESYVQLKRRADNRDQWRTWRPGEDEGDDEEDDES